MALVGQTTNFTVQGLDIGASAVTKEYLIEVYPSLIANFRFAGLWGWGNSVSYGQLGTTPALYSSPVQTVAGGTNWKLVSSSRHTAAIKTDGTLWCWGRNDYGEVGDNTVTYRSSPVQTVSGGSNWLIVSCGDNHTGAIKTDGTLWMWGYNLDGELGDNSTTTKSSPVQTVSAGTNWKAVSCGADHTAAIKTDGSLWLWGSNAFGQLGNNLYLEGNKSSPVQTVSAGTNWRQVSCGNAITAAIKTDGSLWLWGYNFYGGLGNNSTADVSSPVQTVAGGTNWKSISCPDSSYGIKTDGTLWCWGDNTYGQLGDGTIIHRSSPVQTVAGGTNWLQVSGQWYRTAAIKTDGTLWVWGNGSFGGLADGASVHRSSPVQTISGGANWRQVTNGFYSISAIRDDSQDLI